MVASQSTPIRGTSLLSPAWGPAPVTMVPTTISATVTAVNATASRPARGGASGRGSSSPSRARSQVTAATVISAVASRKCAATVYGLSSISTVTPPSRPLATTSQNCAQAARDRPRRRGLAERTARIAQPTAAHSTYVSRRLPNSMAPWRPISGVATRLSPLHLGQVSHPSPEPVSRTTPPVTTMTTLIVSAVRVARSTVRWAGVQRLATYATGFRANSSRLGTGPS